MTFIPREWQKECWQRCKERFDEGQVRFSLEACMGAGKSLILAWIAKMMLEDYGIDHVLVQVPSTPIQDGVMEAFGKGMGLDVRGKFFTRSARQPKQKIPELDATVALYHETACQETLETLAMWQKESGFQLGLICDEIHHTNERNGVWGHFTEQIAAMAARSVFASGTFFRGDRKPLGCIEKDNEGNPIKDFVYPYRRGVSETVVRPVTVRKIDAKVTLYNTKTGQRYETSLSSISQKELSAAKKQVLLPDGECIRHIIEESHEWMTQTRRRFPDAACLYVCRPGGDDDFGGDTDLENKHVHQLAKQIRQLTGIDPVVITHRDPDAVGKIKRFRNGTDPYLAAVNMISEGCNIPRLRSVAFCRYTDSEMLFRQIAGRALRTQEREDGSAALIFIPTFPKLLEFAGRLWDEAKEGVRLRLCRDCGMWPCICIRCFPPKPGILPNIIGLDATPVPDGGCLAAGQVEDEFIRRAVHIIKTCIDHAGCNPVQVGHLIKLISGGNLEQSSGIDIDPTAERERLCRRVVRAVKNLAYRRYQASARGQEAFSEAWTAEITSPFKESWTTIRSTWALDRIREVVEHLDQRLTEVR
jgi:superfamily II DNA or RNA helicase